MTTVPNHLLQSREWAAVHLILTEVFPQDHRVWRYVDLENASIDFPGLLTSDQVFSSSERILLTAAASFWSCDAFPISLGYIARSFGDGTLRVLLDALAAARGKPLPH